MYNIDKLILISSDLKCLANNLANVSANSFGYRERIQIERLLFLFTKLYFKTKYEINMKGFWSLSFITDKKLLTKISAKDITLATKISEVKIFCKQLSSANAYTKADAVLNVSDTFDGAIPMLVHSLVNISELALSVVTHEQNEKNEF